MDSPFVLLHAGVAELPGAAPQAYPGLKHHGEELCLALVQLVRAEERRAGARLNCERIAVRRDEMVRPSLRGPHGKARAAMLAIGCFPLADFRDPGIRRHARVQLRREGHARDLIVSNPGRLGFARVTRLR